jgi:outer membrane protein TolC
MLKYSSSIFVLFFLLQWANAQKTVMSLDQARQYGLENRRAMTIADLEILSAQKRVLEATSIGLPQVNMEGNFQQFINIPTSVVDASFLNPNAPPGSTVAFRMGTKYSMNAGITASQLLFDGSYFVGLQVTKHVAEFVGMNKTQVAADLQYQITQAYFNVLMAQANVEIMDSIVLSTEAIYLKMKKMQEIGFMEQEDVDQFEINWSRALAMKNNAQRLYTVSISMLKMQIGYPFDQELAVDEKLNYYLNKMILEYGELKSNLEGNIQLMLLEKRKEISEYELKYKKYVHFPQLSTYFQHQYMAFRNEFTFFESGDWFPSTAWGVTLRIPISSGGMRNAQMQMARIDVLKREEEIAETRSMLMFQEIRLIQEFESAIEQLRIEEKNVTLALRIYNNTSQKREIGTASTMEMTQVYAQVLSAQADFIRACSNILMTKNELDNLYGTFNTLIETK